MPEHPSGQPETEVWHRFHRYPYLLAKFALFAVAVLGIYVLFHSVQSVLFPVLASLLIAYLLDPVVDRLQTRGWSRTRSILLLLAIGCAALGLFMVFLVPTLVHQIGAVVKAAPNVIERIETEFLPWAERLTGLQLPKSVSDAIREYGDTLQAQLPQVARTLSQALGGAVARIGAVAAGLVYAIMIPVFTFYFLRDFDRITASFATWLPPSNRIFIMSRIRKVDTVVGAWFRGQIEVALILSGLYAIGLAGVFGWAGVGISAGIAVGVLAGLLNIIPYLGFFVGFVLSLLMVILQGAGLAPIGGVLVVFAVVQGLEGWVITPRIMGDKVGLSPVVVIISLLLGQELLGLGGVLLALPIAGGLRVLMPDFIAYYRSSSWFTGTVNAETERRSFIEVAMQAEAERVRAEQAVTAAPPTVS